jgi:histidine triad (HIT) family protein
MKKDDCVFCKIIENTIPSATIYEDDEFKVILDIFPSSLGHTLVIYKDHVENIFEMPLQKVGKMFELAAKIAAVVKKQLNCDGINILQNNGVAAGQSVSHFHIHIIPRYDNDQMNIPWELQKPTDEQIQHMKNQLLAGINIE